MSKHRTAEDEDNQLIVAFGMVVVILVVTGLAMLVAGWS